MKDKNQPRHYADAVDERCHPIPEDDNYKPRHYRPEDFPENNGGTVVPVESED